MREFSGNIGESFKANGGKLFLVDNNKNNAIKSLAELFSTDYSSYLFIVGDGVTANDFKSIFSQNLGAINLIDSYDAFIGLINAVGITKLSESSLIDGARKFKEKYPKIVIAANETGAPLLHRTLCSRTSINGIYSTTTKKTPFLISDFLAECRYDFAVADNIYGLISYEHKIAPNDKGQYKFDLSPLGYDAADFLGVKYFFNKDHSYKRLKNIFSVAKGGVILSDLIFREEVAEVYFALSLLHEDYSYIKSVEYVKNIQNSYEDDSATLSADLTYALDENGIISACMRLLKGKTQYIPSSVQAMGEYLKTSIEFLSQEEIFVKAVHSYLTATNTKLTISRLIQKLADSSEESARCFCNMFFNDAVKAELESSVKSSSVVNMRPDEIKNLMRVFCKYGLYCAYSFDRDCFSVFRIIRDDSGYENMVRYCMPDKLKDTITADYCFSASGKGSDLLFKCAAVGYLLSGNVQRMKFTSPVLIVSDGDRREIKDNLKKLLPAYSVIEGLDGLKEKKENTIAIATSSQLRDTALSLSICSAAFFDFVPDISVMRLLINKVLSYGNVNAALLVNYGSLSGHMADFWQNSMLTVDKDVPPVGVCSVAVKEDSSLRTYEDVISKLDEVYGDFVKLNAENVGEFVTKYCSVVNEFSLQPPLLEEIKDNFNLIKFTGKHFENIFANSMSVGGQERVIEENLDFSNNKYIDKPSIIFFNVCARYLRRTCNIYENDCGGCDDYLSKKMRRNDLDTFVNSVNAFFTSAAEFYEKQKNTQDKGIIWSGKVKDYNKVIDDIKALGEKSGLSVKKILKMQPRSNGPFYASYSDVKDIQDSVNKIYSDVIFKHYKKLISIFMKASAELGKSLKTVNSGFAAIRL